MKTVHLIVGALLAAVIGAGCQSKLAFTEYKGKIAGDVSGLYDVKVEGSFAEAAYAHIKAKKPELFAKSDNAVVEPITIKIASRTYNDAGGLVALNDLLGLCTLTIWPHVGKEKHDYDITIISPFGEKKDSLSISERAWTSLSPICLIPYPSSGDWRGENGQSFGDYENEKLADVVMTNLHSADYARYKKEELERRAEAKRIRDIEVARIDKAKEELKGLQSDKKWNEVITFCEAELKSLHAGAIASDRDVWNAAKSQAQSAIAEEERIAREKAEAEEAARLAAIEAAQNKEIQDAILADRKRRLLVANKNLLKAEKLIDADERDARVKRIKTEIQMLKKLIDENPPIDIESRRVNDRKEDVQQMKETRIKAGR